MMKLYSFLCTTAFLFMLGCTDTHSYELPEIDYYLVVTDSIGVEYGDSNFVLVWPQDARYTPDGDIAVVDMMKNMVLFYSPEGEFIRSVGQEGEGPGRFRSPFRIRFASDGAFLVQCMNGISCFDSSYEFNYRMEWSQYTPSLIGLLDDDCFIGRSQLMEADESGFICTFTLGRWDDEGDQVAEFYSNRFRFPLPDENGVMDLSRHDGKHFFSCASRDGKVFYTVGSTEIFEVIGFECDGTQFFHVSDEAYIPILKTEEEIQHQTADRESTYNRLGDETAGMTVIPDPHRPSTLGLHLDSDERLWVRLGYCPGIVFRVYDLEGQILFHAKVEHLGNDLDYMDWAVNVSEQGFLAYHGNPDDYTRIYILELVAAD